MVVGRHLGARGGRRKSLIRLVAHRARLVRVYVGGLVQAVCVPCEPILTAKKLG
jgi:hypothetical protein